MAGARVTHATVVLVAILGLAAAAPPASAQQIEYDQTYTPAEIYGWWSIALLAPVGQEFVPQVARFDVVELYVFNQDSSAPQPADLFVRIHRDSITGAVVGTSATVTVPYPNDGPVRFGFTSPVDVQIDAMHALELVAVPGGGNAAIAGGPDVDLYPPGRGVVAGTRLHLADMWFRTGARVVAVDPTSWGAVKRRYRD